jgi:hypothetical protein
MPLAFMVAIVIVIVAVVSDERQHREECNADPDTPRCAEMLTDRQLYAACKKHPTAKICR